MKMNTCNAAQPLPLYLKQAGNHWLLNIYVAPRSSRNRVVGEHDGRLKIALCAPPVDGEANAALLRFLSDALRLPQSALAIASGHTGRRKVVSISGSSRAAIEALILGR